ncbi:MAG: anaerobic sulfatase maturase [Vibrio sp.]|uniref:anaerobic sulfatase maturase n=1 Tax=Vibrio sp. TaxID=678 RepID=UPI003A86258C
MKDFHLMAKPTSYQCNLNCDYCFYLEKKKYYKSKKNNVYMNVNILEKYIKQYIDSQDSECIEFSWQGGEPTLAGIEFFELAVKLQEKYGGNKQVRNTFQTNGILINEKWAKFLAKYDFLVGISIDGTQIHHDQYRITTSGNGTFKRVVNAIELFNQHGVEYNTMTVVNNQNYKYGKEIYLFLKSLGSRYHQYIPILEYDDKKNVFPYSAPRDGFGLFMIDVFDEWIKKDVGNVFVQLFDASLFSWHGYNSSLCIFNQECGKSMVIERNGDIYSCDHFVYPEYLLGNILKDDLKNICLSGKQVEFGRNKSLVSDECLSCQYHFACNGGCPKHRVDVQNNVPHNYLCASYQCYFHHVDKYMSFMSNLINEGLPVTNVMTTKL